VNGKRNNKRKANDTGSDSGDNGDDLCKGMVPTANKNIKGVMILIEYQTDAEHI
jgi:hypothetical protein